MFDIKLLRQRKTDTLAKAKAVLEAAQTASRDLTDAERAEYDTAMAQVAGLNGDITRVERLMDEERHSPDVASAVKAGADNAVNAPWASFGEQLKAVASQARGQKGDPRLYAALGANESVPAEGGFLVAPEFASGLLERVYTTGEVTSRCFDQPMGSNRLVMNAVDEDSRADGSRWGGVLGYWLAEAASYTATKPKFRQIQLIANKLIALNYVTDEMLEDGPALESYVGRVTPQELAFKTDDAAINGSGAGMPLGVMVSGANVSVAKDSADVGVTVSTNDILGMWTRLWAASRKSAVWFINQDVEVKLFSLTLGSPSLGQILLYTPPGTNGNAYGMLMGRPVVPIEQCATLGTEGDIILADMQAYLLGRRGGLKADSSIHVAFLTGETAFRFTLRCDGQPWWKKPLTPKNSAKTLSPFVTLQARS